MSNKKGSDPLCHVGGGELESSPVRHSFYKFFVTFFNLLR